MLLKNKNLINYVKDITIIIYTIYLMIELNYIYIYLLFIIHFIIFLEINKKLDNFDFVPINLKYRHDNNLLSFFYLFHIFLFIKIIKLYIDIIYIKQYPHFTIKKFLIIILIIFFLIITKIKIIILYIIYISIKNQTLENENLYSDNTNKLENFFFNQFLYNYIEDTKTFTSPFFCKSYFKIFVSSKKICYDLTY